ncbi:MAG: hypothetical protein N2037_13180 [Acidimicrobiales bacterium]|nr:hypothetical protein [Acidimicrobiales bacterium]
MTQERNWSRGVSLYLRTYGFEVTPTDQSYSYRFAGKVVTRLRPAVDAVDVLVDHLDTSPRSDETRAKVARWYRSLL